MLVFGGHMVYRRPSPFAGHLFWRSLQMAKSANTDGAPCQIPQLPTASPPHPARSWKHGAPLQPLGTDRGCPLPTWLCFPLCSLQLCPPLPRAVLHACLRSGRSSVQRQREPRRRLPQPTPLARQWQIFEFTNSRFANSKGFLYKENMVVLPH